MENAIKLINLTPSQPMPTLFVGHGSPMNAIENNLFSDGWKQIAQKLDTPQTILCISAHWESYGSRISTQLKPETIHDFGGFPSDLYQIQYPAPGNPTLAKQLIDNQPQQQLAGDDSWGLDHGTWSILRHMYPEADIPVLQLSLDYRKTPRQHYELAKELQFLRNHGVLIIGSGNIVHNLRQIDWTKSANEDYAYDWALTANQKIKQLITDSNHDALIDYQNLGKDVQLAVPTADHFLPLLYILATKKENEHTSIFNDYSTMGSLTMTSVIVDQE